MSSAAPPQADSEMQDSPSVNAAAAAAAAADGKDQEQTKSDLPEGASETIYIKNLNEKVKLPILKTSLSALFSTYGKILSVTAHSNLRMRGQAFIAFERKEAAAQAVKEVNGFPLYGKGMHIAFARSPSDAVVKASNPDAFADHKAQRGVTKRKNRRGNPLRRKELAKKIAEKQATEAPAAENKRPPTLPDEYVPPNKILFVQSVPSSISNSDLESLFGTYPNLVDVRSIPGKAIAFAEFTDVNSSTVAKDALNGHRFPGEEVGLKITFVRA